MLVSRPPQDLEIPKVHTKCNHNRPHTRWSTVLNSFYLYNIFNITYTCILYIILKSNLTLQIWELNRKDFVNFIKSILECNLISSNCIGIIGFHSYCYMTFTLFIFIVAHHLSYYYLRYIAFLKTYFCACVDTQYYYHDALKNSPGLCNKSYKLK